ncbi:MAG: C39 family peptidase [Lachnospiraceae bacterium]|nr:C39 family peptidase [Lachnospiraceae bacterium]
MQKQKSNHIKTVLICIVIGVLLILLLMLALRLRGSVVVRPNKNALILGEVAAYRQDDDAWAKARLGDSRFTMKSSGCLVTCIASAVSTETGSEITPGELNEIFSENRVYDSEGNIQWAAIDKIEGYSAEVFQSISEQEIAQCLAAGHYPIVRVRMHGIGNFHYVLIVGVEDGAYLCMDPLENELTKLSQYLNRVYAVRMVFADM